MTQTQEHFQYEEAYKNKKNASACTDCRENCKIVEVVDGERLCPQLRVFEKHPFDTGAR